MQIQSKIQKDIYFIIFTLLPSIDCILFILFILHLQLLTRNLVLDNHLVELGTQGNFFCRLLEEERRSNPLANSPRVRYKTSSHPCGENKFATTLCTWSPNVITKLLPSVAYGLLEDVSIRLALWRPLMWRRLGRRACQLRATSTVPRDFHPGGCIYIDTLRFRDEML